MTSLGREQPSATLEQPQLLPWPFSCPPPACIAALQGRSFLYSAGGRPVHCLSPLPGLASLRAVIGCALSPLPACDSLGAPSTIQTRSVWNGSSLLAQMFRLKHIRKCSQESSGACAEQKAPSTPMRELRLKGQVPSPPPFCCPLFVSCAC